MRIRLSVTAEQVFFQQATRSKAAVSVSITNIIRYGSLFYAFGPNTAERLPLYVIAVDARGISNIALQCLPSEV